MVSTLYIRHVGLLLCIDRGTLDLSYRSLLDLRLCKGFVDYRGMRFLRERWVGYDRIHIPVVYSRIVVFLLVRIGSDLRILRIHPCN